jgi:hypothetical protein
LFHQVDGRVGDQRVEGAEIIGYDPRRAAYVSQYFGSDGPAAYEASFGELDGAPTWTTRSNADRFTAPSATTATRSPVTGSCTTGRAGSRGWTSP